jgi:hypothetical protein
MRLLGRYDRRYRMTHFEGYSYTKSAQVLPPAPDAKDAPRIAAVRDLMAAHGCSAIEAMHRLERKDKHRALLPPSAIFARANADSQSLRLKILERITGDWQTYHAFVDLTKTRGNLHAELSRMVTDGKIECISGKGRVCAQYRKLG